MNLIEKINTWEDVIKHYNDSKETDLPFKDPITHSHKATNAHWRITQTIKLFKKGNKCSYKPNNQQTKFFVWMQYGKAPLGLGFSFTSTNADYVHTLTCVGPRLSSLSDAAAIHIATVVCKEDYEIYYNE